MPICGIPPAADCFLSLLADSDNDCRLRDLIEDLGGRGLDLDAIHGDLVRAREAYGKHARVRATPNEQKTQRWLRQRRDAIWNAALRGVIFQNLSPTNA